MSFESLENVVESCPIRGRTVSKIGTIKGPELCWVGKCSAHYALTVPRSIFKCSEEVALCYAAMHLFVSLSGKEAWSFLAAIIPPLRRLLTRGFNRITFAFHSHSHLVCVIYLDTGCVFMIIHPWHQCSVFCHCVALCSIYLWFISFSLNFRPTLLHHFICCPVSADLVSKKLRNF